MNADRDPVGLWKVLSMLKEEIPGFGEDLQIKLIGKVAPEVRKNIYTYNLSESLIYIDYLPHQEVLRHQSSAQVLLLAVNKVPSAKGIITGKIFLPLLKTFLRISGTSRPCIFCLPMKTTVSREFFPAGTF